ncbi:MAG: hypothetical protein AAGF11_55305 [Myxococcota bacterium]
MSDLLEHFELELVSRRLIRVKAKGDFGGDVVHELFDIIDKHVKGQPFWLFEADISELGHADPSARRAAAERIGQTPAYSLAIFGGALAQRAVALLFLKVAELFSTKRDVSYTFAKDQRTAAQWLQAEEERRSKK